MIRAAWALALAAGLALLPAGLVAQTPPAAETAPGGGELRGLDRMAGDAWDFRLAPGAAADFGPLRITMHECRFPEGAPLADAWAHLTIVARDSQATLFEGWMIASSPALSALDHPRYDVWVLRCIPAAGAPGNG